MLDCPDCRMRNPAGTLFCLGCAKPIGLMAPAVAVAAPPPGAVGRTVRLVQLENLAPTGLAFALPATDYDGTLIIGRNDLASGVVVDVDLTAHQGRERHVSRRHLRLHYAGGLVHAEDAGSLAGSYVNKQRLADGQREPLADGDELRLADMVFRVALR
ncbi:MAG: FHA domain-containing protein [Candidatus Sericytochromatia bacterium]